MKQFFTAVLCVLSTFAFSQQINVWRFGQGAGLDFNSGSPVALSAGPMTTFECAASVCDNQGQLLFYTDGVTVWNRNNIAMPNGNGLSGGNSATQALIVQKPNDCSKYYIFHSGDHITGNIGGYYSVVDMCLNGGLGDVVAGSKNIQILTNCSEKWTAVKHSNGTDIWILCHELGNANYRKFVLSPSGVGASTVQSIGSVHSNNCSVGYMKASHSGQKIVTANPFNCTQIDMFDFNATTGQLSSYVNLTNMIGFNFYYGIEFSPNDQLLYLSDCYVTAGVYQVDLSNYAVTTLATSGSNYAYGGMQLGPDGKIYIARTGQNYLSAINSPNTPGVGCGFVNNGVTLAAGTTSDFGLINFVPWYSTTTAPQFVSLGNDTTLGCSNPLVLAPASACNATYLWSTSSTNDTLTVTTSGTYWVEITNACGVGRDTITVTGASGTPAAQFIYPMSAQCGFPVSFLNTSSGATTYSWNFGDNTTSTVTSPSHTYASAGTYQVMLIASSVCGTDTMFSLITVDPANTISQFTSSGTACGSPVTFTNTSTSATTYLWDFGDNTTSSATSPTHIYTAAGTYQIMLIASSPCDSDTSYALITVVPGTVTAAFSSVPTACTGSPVFFSNSSSGATSSVWDFGDSGTSTATSPVHSYSVAGTYTVTLIVSGNCSSDTISQTITINAVPVVTITGQDTICVGQTITLTASGGTSYQWSGGSSSTNPSISITPSSNTAYYVQAFNGTCASIPDTHFVIVQTPPVAIISGPTTICSGQSVTLVASGGTSYQWSGASSATTGTITESPASTSVYYVTPISQCIGTPDTHTVTVLPTPIVNASGNTTICAGQSTTLTATGGTSYQWSGGSTDTTAVITVTPTATTTYFVTSSNGFCTSAYDTITVVVTPTPTVTIVGTTMICPGTPVTLTAVGNATTYVWSGAASGTGTTITDNPTSQGNYYVVGYNNLGCSDTDMIHVGLYDVLNAAILGDDSICVGESTGLSCAGNGTFTWGPSTGLNTTTGASVIANPTSTITYSVTFTDVNGCTTYDSVTVYVDQCSSVEENGIPDAFVEIYPNPAGNSFALTCQAGGLTQLSIFNAVGELVLQQQLSVEPGISQTIDVTHLSEGVYFLQIGQDSTVVSEQLIITR